MDPAIREWKTPAVAIALTIPALNALGELRVRATDKWVRALSGEDVVVSSTAPLIVWEPRRVVPSYAVPIRDVAGELLPFSGAPAAENAVRMGRDAPPVLDPRTPFGHHTCPGRPLSIRTASTELPGAAFAPDDPDLADHVILDWESFTEWREEEAVVIAHPHDPFDRIDCLPTSRHIVIASDGVVLADTTAATALLETPLPTRYYLPREDVRMDLLRPSTTRTRCAYKGIASYWSAQLGDRLIRDVCWAYDEPLHDATPVTAMICFFTERLDLTIDGQLIPRPMTPWS